MRPGAIAAALVAAAGLAGCSSTTQAVIDVGLARTEAGIKAFHDREAIGLKQAACAMSVGGYWRALTPAERGAVDTLCGGEPGLTFQDLQSMAAVLRLLEEGGKRTLQP